MGRRASGQILTSEDSEGSATYSVRFRGQGYPQSVVLLGSSRDGWTRARAEHEAQLVAAQIRAGTWMPLPKPALESGEPLTFRELASDYYQRKRRKGLRPNSLADMLNKLQRHLLPFFGEFRVDAIDEELVEAYIEHKGSVRTTGSQPASRSVSPLSTGPGVRIAGSSRRRSTRICTCSPGSSIVLSARA